MRTSNAKRGINGTAREAEGAILARQLRPIRSREEVAKIFGCTQQRIRQMECRVLAKLARLMREEVFFDF